MTTLAMNQNQFISSEVHTSGDLAAGQVVDEAAQDSAQEAAQEEAVARERVEMMARQLDQVRALTRDAMAEAAKQPSTARHVSILRLLAAERAIFDLLNDARSAHRACRGGVHHPTPEAQGTAGRPSDEQTTVADVVLSGPAVPPGNGEAESAPTDAPNTAPAKDGGEPGASSHDNKEAAPSGDGDGDSAATDPRGGDRAPIPSVASAAPAAPAVAGVPSATGTAALKRRNRRRCARHGRRKCRECVG